jgi:nucleoside-diphosphate-sugar epimerase
MNTLLVVGASGVIGSAVVEHAARQSNWRVCALSRRRPHSEPDFPIEHLQVDLTSEAACAAALRPLQGRITHVVYCAVAESPGLTAGWSDEALMQRNLQMLAHVLGPLADSQTLRHVTIMQGTKAYGAHLHPIALPAMEGSPRDQHANFYWLQEDYLRQICASRGWSWTIFRPQVVLGAAAGVAMNPMPVLGAYAFLCREEGVPCGFPGEHVAIWEATDARLIARACLWAADNAQARNEIFNITNGDTWVPGHHWARICSMLGVEPGPPAPVDLVRFFAGKSSLWQQLAHRQKLCLPRLSDLCGESHHYLNLLMCNGQPSAPWPPALVSTIKIRQAGFAECMDTLLSMRFWFEQLATRRVLPPVPESVV